MPLERGGLGRRIDREASAIAPMSCLSSYTTVTYWPSNLTPLSSRTARSKSFLFGNSAIPVEPFTWAKVTSPICRQKSLSCCQPHPRGKFKTLHRPPLPPPVGRNGRSELSTSVNSWRTRGATPIREPSKKVPLSSRTARFISLTVKKSTTPEAPVTCAYVTSPTCLQKSVSFCQPQPRGKLKISQRLALQTACVLGLRSYSRSTRLLAGSMGGLTRRSSIAAVRPSPLVRNIRSSSARAK